MRCPNPSLGGHIKSTSRLLQWKNETLIMMMIESTVWFRNPWLHTCRPVSSTNCTVTSPGEAKSLQSSVPLVTWQLTYVPTRIIIIVKKRELIFPSIIFKKKVSPWLCACKYHFTVLNLKLQKFNQKKKKKTLFFKGCVWLFPIFMKIYFVVRRAAYSGPPSQSKMTSYNKVYICYKWRNPENDL